MKKGLKGFTLIEVLIVIAIIGILAAVTIVAINPARQFAQARNSQRSSGVNTILNAVWQYAVDTNGNLPPNVVTLASDTWAEICMTGGAPCTGLLDIPELTLLERYLVTLPNDPNVPACSSVASSTCYWLKKSANDRITVKASSSELNAAIQVTR